MSGRIMQRQVFKRVSTQLVRLQLAESMQALFMCAGYPILVYVVDADRVQVVYDLGVGVGRSGRETRLLY